MSENPFETQTTMPGGELPPVGVKSAPSGVQFHLTVCLILAILGILGSCMGGCTTAITEFAQYQTSSRSNAEGDVGSPAVSSDEFSFSLESSEPALNGFGSSAEFIGTTNAEPGSPSFESQAQQVGRHPVLRVINVIILLFGIITAIVLLLACIKGMRRQAGAPKSMAFALAVAIFYKVTGIFFGVLGGVITWIEMNRILENGTLAPEQMTLMKFSLWAAVGITAFAIFLAMLMAGYYVYARGVFKRSDVLAYFDSK
jgi:hypothetical protein